MVWRAQLAQAAKCPTGCMELLKPLHAACVALHEQVRAQGEQIEAASTGPKPKGLGALSEQVIEREVGDWHRFKNRRQGQQLPGPVSQ